MIPTYIALGSNLGEPALQLRAAVAALDALPATRIERLSPVYRSTAVGPGSQPDYLNAVALLTTTMAPMTLLEALQQIESRQGRERAERWGARTLDLDILLYGAQEITSTQLKVPHPAMRERNFVLYPLADVSDDNLQLPDGTDLDTLVSACPRDNLVKTPLLLR